MKELDEHAWLVYFMCDKDVREQWATQLADDMPSISAEQIMTLWQQLLQLQDNQLVSVLFQFVGNAGQAKKAKTKALLFTREDDGFLVCNGIGGDNLVNVTVDEMVDFLNWWTNLETHDIPLYAHAVYRKVFRCSTNVKSVHLFTETFDMVNNTNLRLAQFNMICEAAQLRDHSKVPRL